MARLKRIVAVNLPHHIVQRGNRRQDVFFTDEDRIAYLDYVSYACERYGVEIWAWCMMTNHVHFVAIPRKKDSLSRCFSEAHVKYTRRINFRMGWRGHLWQGRFGSSPLNEIYLMAAVRYVERNPVRAKIVKVAWKYKWSSAKFRVGEISKDPLVYRNCFLSDRIKDWKKYLSEKEEPRKVSYLRKESMSGRPLGNEAFIKKLEKKYKMELIRKPSGRPKLKIN